MLPAVGGMQKTRVYRQLHNYVSRLGALGCCFLQFRLGFVALWDGSGPARVWLKSRNQGAALMVRLCLFMLLIAV